MNSATEKPESQGYKYLVFCFVLIGAMQLHDYFFNGRHLADLAGATAFSLMAYGTHKNQGRSRPSASTDASFDRFDRFDRFAHYTLIAGVALAILTLVAKYWR